MKLDTLQDTFLLKEIKGTFDEKKFINNLVSFGLQLMLLYIATEASTYVWRMIGCPC